MNHSLTQNLRRLRLSGLLASLELRLQEASTHALPHLQFLELLVPGARASGASSRC